MKQESMQPRRSRNRGIVLALASLLSLPAGGSGLSLDQAVGQVRQETGGKVVSARTVEKGNRRTHQIRVLTNNGRVKNINVDAGSNNRQRQRQRHRR